MKSFNCKIFCVDRAEQDFKNGNISLWILLKKSVKGFFWSSSCSQEESASALTNPHPCPWWLLGKFSTPMKGALAQKLISFQSCTGYDSLGFTSYMFTYIAEKLIHLIEASAGKTRLSNKQEDSPQAMTHHFIRLFATKWGMWC